MSAASTHKARRELAHRAADGIDITLVWSSEANTVTVEVYDRGTEEYFEVDVPSDRALDAFHHPYAYAARHGLDYELPVLKAA